MAFAGFLDLFRPAGGFQFFATLLTICVLAIAEGNGDAALVLLKAGAETDKKDVDGHLAIDLAPDQKVDKISHLKHEASRLTLW